jgi:hypothetical protein
MWWRSRISLMRPGRLHRGLAIFFIVFTFADLVFADVLAPQLCAEGMPSLPPAVATAATSASSEAVQLTAADSSRPEPSSQPACLGEDCLCCCSHIIPASSVDLGSLSDQPRPSDPEINSLPSSPPQDTFHPPRFS